MTGARALITGLIAASAFVAGAQAADMPQLPPAPQEYAPQYQELLSGFYLRGDIGYSWNHIGSVESGDPVTSFKYTNSPTISLGYGYKYYWFRADVTIDRGFVARFTGDTAAPVAQPQYTARITTLSALANAYIDFGTWAGFTPYVGGGVGVTQLRSVAYFDTSLSVPGVGTPATNKVNVSWALMAGVSYRLKPTWLIDVGYRHLEMGKVSNTTGITTGDLTTYNRISSDEVRIGLRYLFD